MQLSVRGDLTFTVDLPDSSSRPTRCTGRVLATGQQVTVSFSPMPSLGGSSTRPLVRPLARRLDELGLTVQVQGPDGPLLRLGAGVRAPWWQRSLTRSGRIQLVSARALASSLGGPKVFEVAAPPLATLPSAGGQPSPRRRAAVALRSAGRRLTGRRR